jgi:uncharacterized protein YdhG (YjbR/CyaY superfamily)
MEKFSGIDEYIASFPEEVQLLLQEIRETIQKAAPKAEETINYGIPTFKLNGNLIHFGAAKKHIALYPGAQAIVDFADNLKKYECSKGTIQFPLDKGIPKALVTKIVKYRIKQNEE